MWCPKCGNEKTKVVKTDKAEINQRYRVCEGCGYSFMTVEEQSNTHYWKKHQERENDTK